MARRPMFVERPPRTARSHGGVDPEAPAAWLSELDDVVTLPVTLIDVAKAQGWPAHLGVQTSITLSKGDRWVTTADGVSCQTNLTGPIGKSIAIRAALDVPMMTVGPFSFVTGTVRRIELASVAWPEVVDPVGPVMLTEWWT